MGVGITGHFSDRILVKELTRCTVEVGDKKYRIIISPRREGSFFDSFPGTVLVSETRELRRKFGYDGICVYSRWDSEHWCGLSGWAGDPCPACDARDETLEVMGQILPELRKKGYLKKRRTEYVRT
ncbi:MAG: hypothetical protein KKB31_04315 [Nanoarchaeota archaeon]|nr:hypothetical protein [Nanoarchaeota archaeon]